MDIYEYFELCKEQGMTGWEALNQYERDRQECRESLIEELEERQMATAYQQDLIDLYRFER